MVEQLINIKIEEFKTAIRSIPNPPPELTRELVEIIKKNPSKETAIEAIKRLSNFYGILPPKVMTYSEAQEYVKARKPGWEEMGAELGRMYDVFAPKPLGTKAFVSQTFRGQIEGADAIVFSQAYIKNYPQDFPRLVFHEFFHWLLDLAMPTLPPALIEPFDRLTYKIREAFADIRSKIVLRK